MDETNVRDLLEQEIAAEFEDLNSLNPRSKEKSVAIESLAKLYKLKIDEDRNIWDSDEKYNRRIMEGEHHQLDGQLKEKQIDNEAEAKERELGIKESELKNREKEIEIKQAESELKKAEIKARERELQLKENQADTETDARNRELDLKEAQTNSEATAREKELEIKETQTKEMALDRWVNLGLQVGLTLVGIFAYDRWYRRGLKFEETGTITSPMTRNLISRMLPNKK